MKASRSQPILASNGQPEAEPAAAFTPGPWHVKPGDTTGFKTHSGHPGIYAPARPEDDFFILQIAEMSTNVPAREIAANARLIAAAPDLLEAAQAVLAGLCERLENAPGNAVPVFAGIADLSDAIMKALGPSAHDTTEQSDQTREDS